MPNLEHEPRSCLTNPFPLSTEWHSLLKKHNILRGLQWTLLSSKKHSWRKAPPPLFKSWTYIYSSLVNKNATNIQPHTEPVHYNALTGNIKGESKRTTLIPDNKAGRPAPCRWLFFLYQLQNHRAFCFRQYCTTSQMITKEEHVQSYFLFAKGSPCAQSGCKDRLQIAASKGDLVLLAFHTT